VVKINKKITSTFCYIHIAQDLSFYYVSSDIRKSTQKEFRWRLKRMWKVQSFISNEVFLRAIAVKTEYVEDSTKTKPKDQTSQEFD
jgi:hypothetical protein